MFGGNTRKDLRLLEPLGMVVCKQVLDHVQQPVLGVIKAVWDP